MISQKVQDLIARLIQREGGFVDNPVDAGGATNYGITQATFNSWRASIGRPVANVQNLPIDEASQIYAARYFYGPGFDAISDPDLQEFLFDFAVNSGPAAAVSALQTSLNGMGLDSGRVDGDLGPKTRGAITRCQNIPELYYRVKSERWELLLRYIGRDHRQAIFALGWANRLDELNDNPTRDQ